MACGARCRPAVADFFLAAPDKAFERHSQCDFYVRAAGRPCVAAGKKSIEEAAKPRAAEVEIQPPEQVAEIDMTE